VTEGSSPELRSIATRTLRIAYLRQGLCNNRGDDAVAVGRDRLFSMTQERRLLMKEERRRLLAVRLV
jgi:hypothetical protein